MCQRYLKFRNSPVVIPEICVFWGVFPEFSIIYYKLTINRNQKNIYFLGLRVYKERRNFAAVHGTHVLIQQKKTRLPVLLSHCNMMGTNVFYSLTFWLTLLVKARSAESPMDFEWTNPHKSAFTFDPSFPKSLNSSLETPTKKRVLNTLLPSDHQDHWVPQTALQSRWIQPWNSLEPYLLSAMVTADHSYSPLLPQILIEINSRQTFSLLDPLLLELLVI